jgi:biotin carboxyl carrier protein
VNRLTGEALHVRERIVLAPVTGRFVVDTDDEIDPARPGALVLAGSPLGGVVGSGRTTAVTTPFTGVLAGLLAHDGERVREGQPIAWLRVA